MTIKGRLWGAKFGPDTTGPDGAMIVGTNTTTMATLNNGASYRFVASNTKDIYSVKLMWSSVATPGQVTIRIETDTSGKPSGTLYDTNAVLTAQVPAAGLQTYTFGTPPSAGRTIGNAYHIVVLTTTGGTTQTLRSAGQTNLAFSGYPTVLLTAADGTTRTNFAEVTNLVPMASMLFSDASEDSEGMLPFNNTVNTISLFTNAGAVIVAGLKFVTDATLSVAGVELALSKTGTPTAALRSRIYNNANSLVASSDISTSANLLNTGATGRRLQTFAFSGGAVISLTAGTYRIVFDGAADTANTNCWTLKGYTPMTSAGAPSGFSMTTAPNIATPVWTDTTDQVPVRLILNDLTVPASGGSSGIMPW